MNRMSAITAAGAALLLAVAAPAAASAHVSVAPNTAPAGSYALVSIKVPNESATAVTTKITLTLPTDTPILNVSYVPVAGWTTQLVREMLPSPVEVGGNTITEAVTTVIWTAEPGSELTTGQLQAFPLSLGPVPDTGSIVMAAEQAYSDGTVVSWSGTEEGAKHPAPILFVNDAPDGDHHGDAEDHDTDDHEAGSGDANRDATATGSDTIARSLGMGGLIVGAVGIGVAIVALRRKSA